MACSTIAFARLNELEEGRAYGRAARKRLKLGACHAAIVSRPRAL
jgi:hypothetical protein